MRLIRTSLRDSEWEFDKMIIIHYNENDYHIQNTWSA